MTHHTRFVQRRLAIENEHITILKMAINLFIDGRYSCIQTVPRRARISALLRRQ